MKKWRQIWDPKSPKIKSSQNQNPFCPNCRRGFFLCRRKASPPHLGSSRAIFYVGRKKYKKLRKFCLFSLVGHGPYSPGLRPLLLSTRGWAIGIYTMSAKVIATYSIPACKMSVACMHGRGVELIFYLGSESSSGAAKPGMREGGPISCAQAGPKLGPGWAQAGPKPDTSWESKKSKTLTIQIRVAQTVCKVSIHEQIPLATMHLGPPAWCHFLHVR